MIYKNISSVVTKVPTLIQILLSIFLIMEQNQRLVKLLSEKDVDVSRLTEGNISEYLQAGETIKRIKTFVVDPFESVAKQQQVGELYSSDLGSVTIKQTPKKITYTPKELCTLTDSMINMYLRQNSSDRRLDGVKRYDGQITIDAAHLGSLVDLWSNQVLGVSNDVSLASKALDLEKLVSLHTPRLITVDGHTIPNTFDDGEVGLYLSAKEQIKDIQKTLIRPFESAFKDQVESDREQTQLDLKHYGNLSVAVKSVPRQEVNFQRVLSKTQDFLSQVSSMSEFDADNKHFFYNNQRNEPTMYVSGDYLQSVISKEKSIKDTKVKKEISVLYKPQTAHIMMR